MKFRNIIIASSSALFLGSFGMFASAGLEGLNGDNFTLDAVTTQALAVSIRNQLQADIGTINTKLDSLGATVGGQSTAITAAATPVGIVSAFDGVVAPSGYLLCDGSAISKTNYPALFTVIGTSHDTQINTTTGTAFTAPATGFFRLPDYRGVFLRGAGTTNLGITVTVGGWQDDATAKNGLSNTANSLTGGSTDSQGIHSHNVYFKDNAAGGSAVGTVSTAGSSPSGTRMTDLSGAHSHSVTGTIPAQTITGETETRPQNRGVSYIIKY